jgi:hypothetical protein
MEPSNTKEIKWVEVPIIKDALSYDSMISEDRFFCWFVSFSYIRREGNFNHWCVEMPCLCLQDTNFRTQRVDIPIGQDSVVCVCNQCEEAMVRISGLRTKDIKIFVNEKLIQYKR